MNLMQRLHSILAPYSPPATHASSPSARVSSPANTSAFAKQLAEAAVVVTPELAATIPATTPAPEATALPLSAPEKRDTLASLLLDHPTALVSSASETILADSAAPAPGTRHPEPATPTPAAPATAGAWPAKTMVPTSITGPGVNGGASGIRMLIQGSFAYYSDPVAHGIILNHEGRMFNDAVARGFVPNTEQGLETLLAWQGTGFINHDGTPTNMPEDMKAFFTRWWTTP